MRKKEVADRRHSDESKVEAVAVRLGESTGGNQAAERLGMPESGLHNWVRSARAGKLRALNGAAVTAKRPVSELEAENARLRPELASTKLDLESINNGGGVFREGVAVKYAWIECKATISA
jgi:transposase